MNIRYAIPAACAALLVSCGDKKTPTAGPGSNSDQPTIATVNYPLAYFAERLAGDFATVLFEAPSDADPAFWEPSDEQIARIQGAGLILLNGATYAKWTVSTTLPYESTVDTSESFSSNLIEVKGAVTHTHGKSDVAHSHAGTAFTTWMDFKQASAQADTAAKAIAEQWPAHRDSVMKNLQSLQADLSELDHAMISAAAKLNSAPVIASHPVYQYWERAYGLTVPHLLWEPEMDLTAEAMADLKKVQEANPGARYFAWEGEPGPGHVEKLKAVGLTSIVISPCGNRPEHGDFLSVMKDNIAAIKAATK